MNYLFQTPASEYIAWIEISFTTLFTEILSLTLVSNTLIYIGFSIFKNIEMSYKIESHNVRSRNLLKILVQLTLDTSMPRIARARPRFIRHQSNQLCSGRWSWSSALRFSLLCIFPDIWIIIFPISSDYYQSRWLILSQSHRGLPGCSRLEYKSPNLWSGFTPRIRTRTLI